jgi:hypothetical protein
MNDNITEDILKRAAEPMWRVEYPCDFADAARPIDILESAAEHLWRVYGSESDAAVELLRKAAYLIWQKAVPKW